MRASLKSTRVVLHYKYIDVSRIVFDVSQFLLMLITTDSQPVQGGLET